MGLVLGGLSTADLEAEEIIELQEHHPEFTQSEIRRLYKRFRKLDTKRTGGITRADLMKIPELSMNPLAQRIIALFHSPRAHEHTETRNDTINFRDFLEMLSVFSDRAPVEKKERLAFRVYDIDRDGFISENELFEVLKTMVGDNVKDLDLKEMVKRTVRDADKDNDGKLSFEEFQVVMRDEDTASKMTIQFSDDDIRYV